MIASVGCDGAPMTGNINDVWSIALATGAWTQLRPPTGGEACNRSGRTGCTTLCF